MKSSLYTCRPKNFDIMPVFEGTPILYDLKENICDGFGAACNSLKILVLDCCIIVILVLCTLWIMVKIIRNATKKENLDPDADFAENPGETMRDTQYDAIVWSLLNPKKLILGSRFRLGHQLGLEVDYWDRGSGVMRNTVRSRMSQVRVPLLTTHYDLDHICLLFKKIHCSKGKFTLKRWKHVRKKHPP